MFRLNWHNKLILFAIVVAIIPIAVSGYYMLRSTKDELKSSTNYELISTAEQLSQEINTFYTNRWLAPLLLIRSGLESEELGAEEKAAFLSAGIKNIEDIVALALVFEISPNEYVTAIETRKESFAEKINQTGLNVTEILRPSQTEMQALSQKNLTIGTPRYYPALDEWIVTMQLPVHIAGAPSAVLYAQIEMNRMRERVQNQPLSKNSRIMMIDERGIEIFDTEKKDLSQSKVVQDATDMLRAGSRAQGVTSYVRPTGEKIVGCYAFPLDLRWAIIAEINEEQAYVAVSKMLNTLTWWTLFGLAIAIIGALIFSGQISKPILKMSKTAEVISSGQFDVKVEYHAKDEIGILGESLVNMGRALKANFEQIENQNRELEEYSKNLEEKVNQRTAELKEKNIALEETLTKLKETQDQLIVHAKLASLGALTAGIAHEIKNPLNFVTNFSSLSVGLVDELVEELDGKHVQMESESRENVQDILGNLKMNVTKINEHGKRADRIVHSMLQHSRGADSEFQKIDLNAFIEEYVTFAWESMRAKDPAFSIRIEKNFDKAIGEVNVRPPSMSQVILNMLNNAIYATTEKKKQETDDYKPTLTVTTADMGDKFAIRLRDNGTGIPQKDIDKIFEPFFTTKPAGDGTGLGLSLSYDIVVSMHKGELRVESKENEYTEFIIILPK